MKPPATIRIAHRNVSLAFVPKAELLDGARGTFMSVTGQICIQNDMLPPDLAETVIHELLHACWPNFVLPTTDDQGEEMIVSVAAQNLAQVWHDNPKLVAWISWALSAQ